MNEEEKISKNLLILLLVLCIISLIAVVAASVIYSPKVFSPSFSKDEITEETSFAYESEISVSPEKGESNSVFPLGINTATFDELQLIPDIGPATAKLIIDYRNENGTIVTFRELLSIDGIGEKTVERLKEYCIID